MRRKGKKCEEKEENNEKVQKLMKENEAKKIKIKITAE